jgi:hypothetical protein
MEAAEISYICDNIMHSIADGHGNNGPGIGGNSATFSARFVHTRISMNNRIKACKFRDFLTSFSKFWV